jgi:DNA-binding transcriptional MerR regulator
MDNDRQVTIGEAAKLLAVHPNTIRNWQAAGKLKSAHKALDGKKSVWLISLQEVTTISYQHHNNTDNNPANIIGYTIGKQSSNKPDNKPTGGDNPPAPGQAAPADMEQSLLVLRDSWIKPFEEIIERQAGQLERLQEERRQEAITAAAKIATLEERLKQLEISQQAPTSPAAVQAVEIPAGSLQAAIAPPQAGISPRRRGWLSIKNWWLNKR